LVDQKFFDVCFEISGSFSDHRTLTKSQSDQPEEVIFSIYYIVIVISVIVFFSSSL